MNSPKYLALTAICMLMIGGCKAADPKTSDNIAALSEIIDIQIPVKSGRWEPFTTPETAGIVLGPGNYLTLIAELQADKGWHDSNKEPTGEIYIVPEAARPWLTDEFRHLLDKNKNSTANLSTQANCRKYVTTLKKSNKPASGFVCTNAGHVLIYLTIASAKKIEAERLK